MKLKLSLLFGFVLANGITHSQVLRYDIFSYENCIYDQKEETYKDCKETGTNYLWIEFDKNKKVIRFMAGQTVSKKYFIKKTTVIPSSTEYFVSDESGRLTWLFQLLKGDDIDFLELQVWKCNKKGEAVYNLGKASIGVWVIESPEVLRQ